MTLQEYRKKILSLTQSQMAEELGVEQASLARSEKNWPKVSTKTAFSIARTYNAHIVFCPDGHLRFATKEESDLLDSPVSQGDLIENLDYLPDVIEPFQ